MGSSTASRILLKPRFTFDIVHLFSFMFSVYVAVVLIEPSTTAFGIKGVARFLISAIRDSVVLVCFALVMIQRRKKIPIMIIIAVASVLIFFLLSIFNKRPARVDFASMWPPIRNIMICFVIANLPNCYSYSWEFLLKEIILVGVVIFFATVYIYFTSYSSLAYKFYNRVSTYNPSIQSSFFLTAFVLVFFYRPFNGFVNFAFSLILMLATLMTLTATAILALFMVMMVTVLDRRYRKHWAKLFGAFALALFLIVMFSGIDFAPFFSFFEDRVDELSQLLWKYLSGNYEAKTSSGSFHIREKQIARLFARSTVADYPFGCGTYSIYVRGNAADYSFMIENTYFALISDFGFLGETVFLCFLMKNFFAGIKCYFKRKDYAVLLATILIALYSMTLYIFYVTNICVALLLCHRMTVWPVSERKPAVRKTRGRKTRKAFYFTLAT